MASIFVAHHKEMLSIMLKIDEGLLSFLEKVKDLYSANYSLLKRHAEEFIKMYEGQIELHIRAEEEALLPYIKDKERVLELLNEHEIIREKIKYLRGLNVEEKPKEVVENLTQLVEMLKNHVEKENELYHKWEKELTNSQMKEISRKVGEIYGIKE